MEENPTSVLGLTKDRKIKLSSSVNQILHIPNFSGDGEEDLLDWLDHFESAAFALEWDESTKLKALPAYLTGTASKWYRCRIKSLTDDEIPKTFEDLKRKMVSDLAPSGYRKSLIKELNAKKQRPDQSAIAYAYEVRDLCRRINPDMQEELVNSFIDRGLKSNIRTRLDLLTADSSTDFISKVTQAERSLLSRNDDLNGSEENDQLKDTISSLTKQLHDITERLDCLTFQSEVRKRERDNIRPDIRPRYPTSRYDYRSRYDNNQRSDAMQSNYGPRNYYNPGSYGNSATRFPGIQNKIVCYRCGKEGHKQNECPQQQQQQTTPKSVGWRSNSQINNNNWRTNNNTQDSRRIDYFHNRNLSRSPPRSMRQPDNRPRYGRSPSPSKLTRRYRSPSPRPRGRPRSILPDEKGRGRGRPRGRP